MLYIFLAILIGTGISAAITAFFMRRKISKTLGVKASNEDLTSLNVWMKVDEKEKEQKARRPLA